METQPLPEAAFAHLLSPGRIGSLELRNRILMAPMGSNLAESDGHVGERLIRYYEERARGGAALLIVGVGAIAFPEGACNPNQVAISEDSFLPGLRELTRRVHAHGARIAIQLQHAGKVAVRDIAAGRPLLVPTRPEPSVGDLAGDLTSGERARFLASFNAPGARLRYREATPQDLERLVDRFAEAADRACRAGFDAVEIHAGHGYLLSSFLSPASNRRTDAYGGPLENRARLLLETLRAVRARVGDAFPVSCRIDGRELRIAGGITLADAVQTSRLAEAAGASAIHVSAYADPTSGAAFTDAPLVHAPCGFVDFARAVQAAVSIPVIAVGRIEPTQADELIASGGADFVAMARKLLADPMLPDKLASGRERLIRPCIYCYTCVGEIFLSSPSRCAVNPASGREQEFEIHETSRTRRVLVAGGGPAGMEAARILALRGHEVILCEKARRLGGSARFAAILTPENGALIEYLERAVRSLPIHLRLEAPVSPEFARRLAPDVAVVAVGARHERPQIPGVGSPHVLDGEDLRGLLSGEEPESPSTPRKLGVLSRGILGAGRALGWTTDVERVRALSTRWMPLGDKVVLLGADLVGIELARFLCERGRRVSLLEEGEDLAPAMAPPRRWRALHELRAARVSLETGIRVEAIEPQEVRYSDSKGRSHRRAADHVILARGTVENPHLGASLRALGIEVHEIGDCTGVGYLDGAIRDAARIARQI
ncbi:MAG: FAD-dependent oxidoreductase [Myxococcota bacterium]